MYFINEKIEEMKKVAEKIVEELLSSEKVRPWQSIDITKFDELYKPYKDKIKKSQFGNILEINYNDIVKQRKKSKNIKK